MSTGDPAPDYGSHFGTLAARYDELRSGPSDEAIETLVREGDLRGRRVLDVGCGTGRMAAALAERHGATVSGIDPSEEMLDVARDRASQGIAALELGTAESIPFPDGSFERALMQLVVHLVDRPRAFAEVRRVLVPGGQLVISTVNPASLDRFWLSNLFPSYATIDRRRFPTPGLLSAELETAEFFAVRSTPLEEREVYERERALQMLRGRFASSFALMSDEEYREGLDRAERELPEKVESVIEIAILSAQRW
jgi:ubiquinone/menaquinone biosynthesis C-methylase UbiE